MAYKQFKYEGDGNREQVIHILLSAPPSQKKITTVTKLMKVFYKLLMYMPNRYVYPDIDTFLKSKMMNILL